jgi:hypothetical protein
MRIFLSTSKAASVWRALYISNILAAMPSSAVPSNPIDAEGMRALFGASHKTLKTDEIGARQRHALRAYQGPRERPLQFHHVNEMFLQMGPDP